MVPLRDVKYQALGEEESSHPRESRGESSKKTLRSYTDYKTRNVERTLLQWKRKAATADATMRWQLGRTEKERKWVCEWGLPAWWILTSRRTWRERTWKEREF